jgi:hypothetical protein
MALIDRTYFVGGLNIPGTQRPEASEVLNGFIAQYEVQYLREAMGYPLAKLFLAAVAAGTPLAQRYTDILEGKEYTDTAGNTQLWGGLVNAEKQSPLAYITYFYYMRNAVSTTATVGEVKSTGENSKSTSPYTKLMLALNTMVTMTGQLRGMLEADAVTA